ncbi:hypothetical protein [Marinobacter sp. DS40M6]|uniref:hypothetical protein n=1 Tax=Marinobacter sp. DS40M6 TaxID=1597776 RepID=UPI0023581F1C|nr:hypothetical protein [Marinobacter sp. DS40M6]MDC8454688.1 hypothetical protein [Marinobacter sp. DS40M6]
MNKHSAKLDDLRARVLDTESLLFFMRDRENLQQMLNHGSPEDPIQAMLDSAYNSISDANELCQALLEARDEDFLAEYKEAAIEAINHAKSFKFEDLDNEDLTAGFQKALPESERTGGTMNARLKDQNDELEKVGAASTVVSELMQRILVERTLQGCPDWMESDYVLGGLVQASEVLGERVCQLASENGRENEGAGHE